MATHHRPTTPVSSTYAYPSALTTRHSFPSDRGHAAHVTGFASPAIAALALVVASLLMVPSATAGPWVAEPGHGYLQLSGTSFRSDDGVRGSTAGGFRYSKTTLSLYSELGLVDGLQFTFELPFALARNEQVGGDDVYFAREIGDVRLALDGRVTRRVPLTFGVEARLPGYRDPSQQLGATGVDDDQFLLIPSSWFPAIGDNSIDVIPRVQIGHGFARVPMWVQASVGYRFRSCQRHNFGAGCRDLRDSLSINAGAGVFVVQRLVYTELYVSGELITQPESDRTIATPQFMYVQGKVSSLLGFDSPFAVTAGVGGIPLGQDTQGGWDVTGAISLKF
jgi:hypothetical protein